jgi:hypothetical protein
MRKYVLYYSYIKDKWLKYFKMLKYFGLLFMFVLLCCVGCVYFTYLALLRMVRVALCASSGWLPLVLQKKGAQDSLTVVLH